MYAGCFLALRAGQFMRREMKGQEMTIADVYKLALQLLTSWARSLQLICLAAIKVEHRAVPFKLLGVNGCSGRAYDEPMCAT
jgi:hypothetical protein